MKAMILNELCGLEENQASLELTELPDRIPSANKILFNQHITVKISGGWPIQSVSDQQQRE